VDRITVATVQCHIKSADTKWNTDNALTWIDKAADAGAQVICLPDNWNTGYATDATMKFAESIPGPTIDIVSSKAKEHKAAIIAGGILEKRDGKVYDTSAIVGPGGELLGKHSKTHIHWRGDTHLVDIGLSAGREHRVFDIPGMCKVGVLLDCDIDPPEAARILTLKGADIIFAPMCCSVLHLNPFLPQCRAKENGVHVAVSNLVGKERVSVSVFPPTGMKKGQKTIEDISYEGGSCITNTSGDMIAFAGARANDGMAVATLDLAKLHREKQEMDPLYTREPELYRELMP
jgi:predicted amidohydrolase